MREPAEKSRRASRREQRFLRHPLFGRIPLVKRTRVYPDGTEREITECDLAYCPDLPPGAVRGNVHKQLLCSMSDVPRYFYVDESKTCVQCGKTFVFAAAEQKYWYETLGFRFESVAIRCIPCRRRRRSERALRGQIEAARKGLRDAPDDPARLIAVAEAVARFHQRTGQGNLDEAIAAARRARKLWPEGAEAVFWEAVCHDEAGRRGRARTLFTAFVEWKPRGKRLRDLRSEALRFLEGHEPRVVR